MSRTAPDPLDTSIGYASVSGYEAFSGDTDGHVIRFDQYGTSWVSIDNGLPDVPANDIVVGPGLPNTLYVATDVGVFVTTDGGALDGAAPHVIVRWADHLIPLHHQCPAPPSTPVCQHLDGQCPIRLSAAFSNPCRYFAMKSFLRICRVRPGISTYR
ncbi:MAG TPA: hypothetical protein VKW78_10630 [Terriglobales bacterium]|nr:hypothetical protein [Terriglobales bacterium]